MRKRITLKGKGYDPRNCPRCGGRAIGYCSHVSRDGWLVRYRRCPACFETYTTLEIYCTMTPSKGQAGFAPAVLMEEEEQRGE